MASIKVRFRASSTAHQEGTIFYQILHDRKQRQYVTDYHIFSSEWNEKKSSLITNVYPERKPLILS